MQNLPFFVGEWALQHNRPLLPLSREKSHEIYFYSVLEIAAKKRIAWSAGEGLALASISLAPVLSSRKKIQEISNQTLQGQGKGPTVGIKRDRVKSKRWEQQNMLSDLAETQTCVCSHDRDKASSLHHMSLHS